MAMITTTEAATSLATVLVTAASRTSTVPVALQTEALHTEALPHTEENSGSMEMGGMSSFIHFGLGDSFFASFFTPTQASGYVAVMLLLMMLSFSQRLLIVVEKKTTQKLRHQARPADYEGQKSKSGSWVETTEDPRPGGGLMSTFIIRALFQSGLQVLNAALGFLV
jgi:hypothetical protein